MHKGRPRGSKNKVSNVSYVSHVEVQEYNGGYAVFLVTVERVWHPKLEKDEEKLARVRKLSPVWGDKSYAERMLPGYKL